MTKTQIKQIEGATGELLKAKAIILEAKNRTSFKKLLEEVKNKYKYKSIVELNNSLKKYLEYLNKDNFNIPEIEQNNPPPEELQNLVYYSLSLYAIYQEINVYLLEEKAKTKLAEEEAKLKAKERELEKREKALEKKKQFKKAQVVTELSLKYTYPKDNTPNLFSILKPETQDKINNRLEAPQGVVEGLRLTASESKVVDTLCKMLHFSSQTSDPTKEDFYTGNKESAISVFSGEDQIAPRIGFTLYELTKEYKSSTEVSGKEMQNVATILEDLSSKHFLIKYKEVVKNGKQRIERILEDFQPIIKLPNIQETIFDENNIEISKKRETIIVLHPIFRSQINSRFISYPEDINKRLSFAYGSSNIQEATIKLKEYLFNEKAHNRETPQIGLDRLYYLLNEKFMRESRKTLVKKQTEKALETMVKLGLLKKYEIVTGATGEPKVIFHINKSFS